MVGVALSELDTPGYLQRFKQVFERAHQMGHKCTTHVDVGEVDALERIWGAINDLQVDGRIDHGVGGLADERFVDHIREADLTLAICPTLLFETLPGLPYYDYQLGAGVVHAAAVVASIDAFRSDPSFEAAANAEITYGSDALF